MNPEGPKADPYRWRRLVRRGGNPKHVNPKQMMIDWDAAPPQPSPVPSAAPASPAPPARTKIKTVRAAVQDAGRFGPTLPVPKPLPEAVAAGRFGTNEQGRTIRPDADEVRAITKTVADKLIDMLDALTPRPGHPATATALPEAFGNLIAAYAEDFGDRAAQRLEAYARRQAFTEESDRGDQGHPGSHGWRR